MATLFYDAFISYARRDGKQLALKLNQELINHGFNVWFDGEDIPLGVDFQKEIKDGIEKCRNFIFIITPGSVISPYCLQEIELAAFYRKRIIPILHVELSKEQISRLHPEIARIQWSLFRQNIDRFEDAFAAFVELLDQHKDYIQQHVELLTKALIWEHHYRSNQYLLAGEERLRAQAWLKQHFETEQAPCEPTDLHCEFICESIKNANNLATQVFLAHAERDRAISTQLSKILMRDGITIWQDHTDIKTGVDFEAAFKEGIEKADNFIYLISTHSLFSQYCQQELKIALTYNKRIIPLTIESIAPETFPETLRRLQFIDLTPEETLDRTSRGIQKLLEILNKNKYYHENHKILLIKALKWERQNQNPSILLRGYNLRRAQGWLEIAKHHPYYPCLPVQEEFINVSLSQPRDASLDVFIAYSRSNADFARRLNESLEYQGKTTWFDQESIASGDDFHKEICQAIEQCDNFVAIVSRNFIKSTRCAEQVEFASSLNKRIVPILYESVPNLNQMNSTLGAIKGINFHQLTRDFNENFGELIRTLDSDREYLHNHTKWHQRAREWEQNEQNQDLLLRGSELTVALLWLEEGEKSQPPPTKLQRAFIETSDRVVKAKEAEEKKRQAHLLKLEEEKTAAAEARLVAEQKSVKRQKQLLMTVTIGLIGAVVSGIAIFRLYWHASIDEMVAITRTSEASYILNERLDALVEAIRAKNKLQHLAFGHPIGWQLVKRLGWINWDLENEVNFVLSQASYGVQEFNRLEGHIGPVTDLDISFNDQFMVSGGEDTTIRLWQWDGTLLKTLRGHSETVSSVDISPDGSKIASASIDGSIIVWNLEGKKLTTIDQGTQDLESVEFSPDGEFIVAGGKDKTVKLWTSDGREEKVITTHEKTVYDVAFSPNGEMIASASGDGTVVLSRLQGTIIKTLSPQRGQIYDVEFSPDGKLIAAGTEQNAVAIWNLEDGTLVKIIETGSDEILDIEFSADGQFILIGGNDAIVKIWKTDGAEVAVLQGHFDAVRTTEYSHDDQFIISASEDGTIRIWKLDNPFATRLVGHKNKVYDVDFSPDGKFLLSISLDQTIRHWKPNGELLNTFQLPDNSNPLSIQWHPKGQKFAVASLNSNLVQLRNLETLQDVNLDGHLGLVYKVVFHPEGQIIATASEDKTIKLWHIEGTLLDTLTQHSDSVNDLQFSPDGETLASAGADNKIILWEEDGTYRRTIRGHEANVLALDFSPDGQLLASAGADETVRLWTLEGKPVGEPLKHNGLVRSVQFSPSGQFLASGSSDETIRFWQRDQTLVATLATDQGQVLSIDFSPDGKRLVSSGTDQRISVWDLEANHQTDILEYACHWVRDYLKTNANLNESDRQLCRNYTKDEK